MWVELHVVCIMGCTAGMICVLIIMLTIKEGEIDKEKKKVEAAKEKKEEEVDECELFM